MSETFTCSRCGGTFKKAWTDTEALAEVEELFPGLAPSDRVIVCNPCFEFLMAHADGEFWRMKFSKRRTES